MYQKYKNKNKYCKYPFENESLGYCWGYANMVDNGASEAEIKAKCSMIASEDIQGICKKGEYLCEYYKEIKWKNIL